MGEHTHVHLFENKLIMCSFCNATTFIGSANLGCLSVI